MSRFAEFRETSWELDESIRTSPGTFLEVLRKVAYDFFSLFVRVRCGRCGSLSSLSVLGEGSGETGSSDVGLGLANNGGGGVADQGAASLANTDDGVLVEVGARDGDAATTVDGGGLAAPAGDLGLDGDNEGRGVTAASRDDATTTSDWLNCIENILARLIKAESSFKF